MEWARYSPPNNFGDDSGEYWALDNVQVTTLGDPLPTLTVRQTTFDSVSLSWPSPSTGFTLEENSDLNTTNWVATLQSVTDDGTNKTVLVNPPVGNRFYRLHKLQ